MTTGGRGALLVTVFAGFIGGVAEAGNRELSAVFFAAALIVLGVWLTLEIISQTRKPKGTEHDRLE